MGVISRTGGREETSKKCQQGKEREMFNGKVILITGGTGSFGRRFAGMILRKYRPRKLIIFSRDEQKHFDMQQEFPESEYSAVRYFIGDVRDRDRLYRAFKGVDMVVHAAALKHVPLLEYNPFEAVRTNIIGTQNVIEAATDREVKKVLLISTDKAANPINLYGSTKLCAEKLIIEGNVYSARKTVFSVARYGNVIGSKGSVLPVFLKLRGRKEVPITDPSMTRFWITLEQGIDLVMTALRNMKGGEIFIPKIPSMKVIDLAKEVCPDARIKIIGIRPGEKIHEVLVSEAEARRTLDMGKYYLIQPDFKFWKPERRMGKTLPEGFEYRSDNNSTWLTPTKLRKIIREYEKKPVV